MTTTRAGKTGGYFHPYWKIICNDKNNSGKKQKFSNINKNNFPTSDSGATSLLAIGNAFMYIETSSSNHGNSVFVSSERTDTIQITNTTFR